MTHFLDLNTTARGDLRSIIDQAIAIVAQTRNASISYLQRRLKIGYNRAARIIEQMESEGVVSSANRVGRREVLIGHHGA